MGTPQKPQLSQKHLEAVIQSGKLRVEHKQVLSWLVWLPLLSREELARVVGKSPQRLWSYISELLALGLVDSVEISESGWPRQHHRYYLTDFGLHTLAKWHTPQLSAQKIARSYPVTNADLLERLARIPVHLVLSETVTRLIAEHPTGYYLTSYQQPYHKEYTDRGRQKHTFRFDAAFLLRTPAGTQHAFYVWVDQPEVPLLQQELRQFLDKLHKLRQYIHDRKELMPHLLLLSSRERFSAWAEQVHDLSVLRGIALHHVEKPEIARQHMDLSCLITDRANLGAGAYALIWTSFYSLITQRGAIVEHSRVGILALLDRPASPGIIEQFSRSFSFQNMTIESNSSSRHLKRYVNIALREEARPFEVRAAPQIGPAKPDDQHTTNDLAEDLSEAFYDDPLNRWYMSTLLTLALSDQQKDLLALLARHPYLNQADLLPLLGYQDERLLQRLVMPLIHLKLLKGNKLYSLCEPALRFLAERHGVSPTAYLDLSSADKRAREKLLPEERLRLSAFSREVTWVQQSAHALVGRNIEHTSGLYRCMRSIFAASLHTHAYQVVYWKSARESYRWYQDPFDEKVVHIKPDAEILYTQSNHSSPHALLIEYDRATSTEREYKRKFRAYAEYHYLTRKTLPPILMITQHEDSARLIQDTLAGIKVSGTRVIVIYEAQVLRDGLSPALTQLHP